MACPGGDGWRSAGRQRPPRSVSGVAGAAGRGPVGHQGHRTAARPCGRRRGAAGVLRLVGGVVVWLVWAYAGSAPPQAGTSTSMSMIGASRPTAGLWRCGREAGCSAVGVARRPWSRSLWRPGALGPGSPSGHRWEVGRGASPRGSGRRGRIPTAPALATRMAAACSMSRSFRTWQGRRRACRIHLTLTGHR